MFWHEYDGKIVKEKIRQYREKLGLTQCAFARKVGCSPHTISNLERDKYPITTTMIIKICRALNLPLADLLDDPKKKEDADASK